MNRTHHHLVLVLILFPFLLLVSEINAQNEVRFIIFGDSQFGNPPEFERMVYEVSLLKPAFVIQVGDLIHGYTYDRDILRSEWKRFKGQISLLNAPFYPVPGNHDAVTDEAEEIYTEVWGNERLYYSFDKGPAHFIILNSWFGTEDDRIMEWQRNWLKEDLENYKSKFDVSEFSTKSIFVFLHSPLWKYPAEHQGKQDWNTVHDILKSYPVKLVVAGHTHEHVWQQSDGVNYLIINSAGVKRENIRAGKFSAFLYVTASEDGSVEYAAVRAGSIFPLDTVDPVDRIEASKYNIEEKTILFTDWLEGESMNRKVEVEIENKLNEDRIYRLDWYIPYQAELKIEPESRWISVPSNSKLTEYFRFTSENTPPEKLMPHLNLSSTVQYRSGVLSRELEKKYNSGEIDIDGYDPAIKLYDNYLYEATYTLYMPPDIKVKRATNIINIDGTLNENEWQLSDKILFGENSSPESVATEISILYNDNYLYIGARMEEPVPGLIQTSAAGDIPLTWNDDDIEFFFDTEAKQKGYIRLFQNAAGTRFNSLQRWVENKYFQSKYKSEIQIGENFWSIELEIPWSDIDLKEAPKPGDKWGLNIGRHRPHAMIKEMRWAGGLYNPQKYGILLFE